MPKKIKNAWRRIFNIHGEEQEQTNSKAEESLTNDSVEDIKANRYQGWKSKLGHSGWNLRFSEVVKEQSYIAGSLVLADQIIILEHNSKLGELKEVAISNDKKWYDVDTADKIEHLILELIVITARLVSISNDNLEARKILFFYIILVGLVSKSSEQLIIHFKRAVEIMEAIAVDFPDHLTAPEKIDFREDISNAYHVLFHSDLSNRECHRLKFQEFYQKRPEKEQLYDSDFLLGLSPLWTEVRIQAVAKLCREGKSADDIAKTLEVGNRNKVVAIIHRQTDFRKPDFFSMQ